jgi:hypothetical protein
VNQGLGVQALQLRDVLPALGASWQLVAGVLYPEHGDMLGPSLVHEDLDVGDHPVALVGLADDAVLHVDDEQCGAGSVTGT